jgi:hypothetical protein
MSVSILDDPDKDVTWQVNPLTRESLRIIWLQRLGRMHSRHVSDMHKCALNLPNLWISMCLKIPLRISALCPYPPPVEIRTLGHSSPPCMLERTSAAGISIGFHQLVSVYVASLLSLSSKPTLLSPLLLTLVQRVTAL